MHSALDRLASCRRRLAGIFVFPCSLVVVAGLIVDGAVWSVAVVASATACRRRLMVYWFVRAFRLECRHCCLFCFRVHVHSQ